MSTMIKNIGHLFIVPQSCAALVSCSQLSAWSILSVQDYFGIFIHTTQLALGEIVHYLGQLSVWVNIADSLVFVVFTVLHCS